MKLDTMHPVTATGASASRQISMAMVVSYLKRTGWEAREPTGGALLQFTRGDLVISFYAALEPSEAARRLGEVTFLAEIEGRAPADVLRDICGEVVTLETAYAAFLATAKTAGVRLEGLPLLPCDDVGLSMLSAGTTRAARTARSCGEGPSALQNAAVWMAFAHAAEDLARLALEQLHAKRVASAGGS